ncbi:MAG TPA: hypothetical protein VF077_00505 [Nitrospiraceae bacterium]
MTEIKLTDITQDMDTVIKYLNARPDGVTCDQLDDALYPSLGFKLPICMAVLETTGVIEHSKTTCAWTLTKQFRAYIIIEKIRSKIKEAMDAQAKAKADEDYLNDGGNPREPTN